MAVIVGAPTDSSGRDAIGRKRTSAPVPALWTECHHRLLPSHLPDAERVAAVERTTAYTDSWYRQPDPVEREEGRRLTNQHWVRVAAVWLLAAWSPEQAAGWSSTVVSGRTRSRRDQQWPEPPPLTEIADAADLPEVTGATVLTSRVSVGPGRPYEPVRPTRRWQPNSSG